MAATLATLAALGTPALRRRSPPSLALLTGVVLLLSRPLRLGWIADLLSIPVTTGFLAGIAVHIVIGQLPTILGLPPPHGALLGRLAVLLEEVPLANPYPMAIAGSVLAVSLLAERIDARIPGALIGLAASAIAVWSMTLQRLGVPVLGALPFAMPGVGLAFPDLNTVLRLLPLSLIVALVCMVQTAVVLPVLPVRRGPPG